MIDDKRFLKLLKRMSKIYIALSIIGFILGTSIIGRNPIWGLLCAVILSIAASPFMVLIMVIYGISCAAKDKNNVQPPGQQYNPQYYYRQ